MRLAMRFVQAGCYPLAGLLCSSEKGYLLGPVSCCVVEASSSRGVL